jgi:O-antigen/teichoic acid export membrane protein
VFAPRLLGLIGPEFLEGTSLLRVLLLGHAVFAVLSIAGLVLALAGGSKINFAISVANAAVMLLGAPIVAAMGGTFGVAAFVSATMVATNLANVIAVRRIVRIDTISGSILPDR